MSEPVVLRIVRPYATEEEYLAAEAWSMSTRSMVLIDQAELPPETLVRFDVALSDGTKVIRAEGKVLRPLAATTTRPGGLQVKFKRFGASTKAFLERAGERKSMLPPRDAEGDASSPNLRVETVAPDVGSSPEAVSIGPAPRAPLTSLPEIEAAPLSLGSAQALAELAALEAESAAALEVDQASLTPPEVASELSLSPPPVAPAATPTPQSAPEPSGVRQAVPGPVDAPKNRDELLARLRARKAAS